MRLTPSTPSAAPAGPEQFARLAAALKASGLGADFARWQPEDRGIWRQVAAEMDRLEASDGAR
jgi:hypothetical protein